MADEDRPPTEPKDHSVTKHAFIIETTQRQYVVEGNPGPLADYDDDANPIACAIAIWTCIDQRGPIWTNAGVVYLNPRHVILVREVKL